MSGDKFDAERFILEIETRPAIWDLSSKLYSDRDAKKKSWMEIVDIFIDKEDASESEKNECGRVLQRKWKSLRDCYSRECQRISNIKSGSAESRKNPYIYYQQLSFLGTIVKGKNTSNSMEEAPTEEASDDLREELSGMTELQTSTIGKRRKAVQVVSKDVQEIVHVLQSGMQSRQEREVALEKDSDRLFLLSLLSPLKEIPENMRFSVKMEIMQVVERARLRVLGPPQPLLGSFGYGRAQQWNANNYQEESQPGNSQQNNTRTFSSPSQPLNQISPISTSSDYSAQSEVLEFTSLY